MRTVKELKLIFSENHNLLMYSKSNFSVESRKEKKSYVNKSKLDDDDDLNDEFEEFENNLFDIEKISMQQRDFQ